MNCQHEDRVSRLIDGELDADEAIQFKEHLGRCPRCRQAQEDFLAIRKEIASLPPTAIPDQVRGRFDSIMSPNPPWWRQRIPVPVPVFGLLLIALMGLASLALVGRWKENVPAQYSANPTTLDLSSYDRGGRATIYVAPRKHTGEEVR